MTLALMLAAHDNVTLEAISSKGLVRRAMKQAQTDDVKIDSVDSEQAVVRSEGKTVCIDASGPTAASCTCPSTSVCRHVLTAILVLRHHTSTNLQLDNSALQKASDNDAMTVVEPLVTALQLVSELSVSQLKKYAGADWSEANHLAAKLLSEQDKPEVVTQGLNSVVSLANGLYSVTFIAGVGLKEAIYKGPKTKKRLMTALGALILRDSIGIPVDPPEVSDVKKGLSVAYLTQVQLALEHAASTVLAGAAESAADKLFDLAISARVQVAPRLSSQLRSLSKLSLQAKDHAIEFDANDFIVLLARSYALVRSLQSNPFDLALTGSMRRDYASSEPLALWVLGAKHWTMPSGARGVTTYAFSESNQTWYSTSIARPAGIQLTFDPYQAFKEPIWGAHSMSNMIGKCVKLADPKVSRDRQISPKLDNADLLDSPVLDKHFLQSTACLVDDWQELYGQIQQRFGQGLTRGALPVAVLVKPKRFGAVSFDELAQKYYWDIVDIKSSVVQLEMPADYGHRIDDLRSLERRIQGILIEVLIFNDELHFYPISLLIEDGKEIQVLNIQFQQLWNYRAVDRFLKSFKDKLLARKQPAIVSESSLTVLANTTIESIVNLIAYPHSPSSELDSLISQCEVAGLMSLTRALSAVKFDKAPSRLLAVVYIASELVVLSALQKKAG